MGNLFAFDYQSERHCSKTKFFTVCFDGAFDYQSERHCSKTLAPTSFTKWAFDYQSERHCSKTHLFIEEHDLADGRHTFAPDYYMATSIQRLIDTGKPKEHDLLLFKHEALEAEYMAQGMSQGAAHEAANQRYNYQKALIEWVKKKEGGANA